MDGQGKMGEWMDIRGLIDGQGNGWMNRKLKGWQEEMVDRRERRIDEQIGEVGWLDGCTCGIVEEWMD